MIENPTRTVEHVLREGPPLGWYYGYGRTNTGIAVIQYSDLFRQAYNGELEYHFGQWSHIGVVPRVFGIPDGEEDKFEQLVIQMHEHASKVYEISGFWPEEIDDKAHALLTIYQGQKSAPFQTILVEQLTNGN